MSEMIEKARAGRRRALRLNRLSRTNVFLDVDGMDEDPLPRGSVLRVLSEITALSPEHARPMARHAA
ncbi:hypothetical protein [Palleronia pelagia]|uniref:Uncharacterized protein n=1 Tax=Palleronia pelagia TaxID=387096 RepID=A0A1H8FHU5_9RHOB|nr:hypothetical protein [Palleronia pelagia]SEN31431.1 hypothetical protein SAMN04488011_103350 [Palleronia pelagia]